MRRPARLRTPRRPALGAVDILPPDYPPEYFPTEGETAAEGTAQEVTAGAADTFKRLWQQFTAIWPSFLALRDELADHAARWGALGEARYRAGDLEGFRAYQAKVTELAATEGQRQAVEDRVQQFREAWEALRSYIAQGGRWLGLGSPGLGLAPLLLAVGIPAALAALAWVVRSYLQIRADLDADLQILQAVEAGRLTPAAAAQLLEARRPAGLFAGAGSWVAPVVIVAGGIVGWLVLRRST